MRERFDVAIIGGGMGGLAAALSLVGRGARVVLVERAAEVGGKVRVATPGGREVDCGPTVLTMRPIFDDLFATVGRRLDDHVQLRPLEVLARHAWPDGSRLDLYTDAQRSADAIAAFAGPAAAEGYRRFCDYGVALLERLEAPFLYHDNDGLFGLMKRVGPRGLGGLARVDFSRTMWRALGDFFDDPRLRQLFARYATYYGSSPFEAPGTLNLIAQVEQRGVWAIEGGMIALARAVAAAIGDHGGTIVTGVDVVGLDRSRSRDWTVRLCDGTALSCRHVVFNGDPTRVSEGHLGSAVRSAVRPIDAPPSLSAMTWSMLAVTRGFPPAYHTVCFSADYEAEFDALFRRQRIPADPTVYVCAQDRLEGAPDGPERLFCLINAPAAAAAQEEEDTCRARMEQVMKACGLHLQVPTDAVVTTPNDFARRFPGTKGALYGSATHGAMAPFRRYRSKTRLPDFHLVGGSIHPGAGLPMVTLGGLLAAQRIAADLASTPRWTPTDTFGGTSTVSPTTVAARSR